MSNKNENGSGGGGEASKKLLNDTAKMAQFELEADVKPAKVKKEHSTAYLKLHGISFGVLSALFYAISSTKRANLLVNLLKRCSNTFSSDFLAFSMLNV